MEAALTGVPSSLEIVTGTLGRRGRADEDGGGAGVEALGPADVDAALSHVMLPFRILTVV